MPQECRKRNQNPPKNCDGEGPPNSPLDVIADACVEPALAGGNSGAAVQFERLGYFCPDKDSTPSRLVFNRTVGLRDSYAKVAAAGS